MTLPTWPEINFLAERGSWALALSDGRGRVSSDMDSGDIRTRRRFTQISAPASFSVRLSSDELDLFKYFYAVVLQDGCRWFQMPIYDGRSYAINLVKFDPASSPGVTEIGFMEHEVSLSLIVRNLTQIDAGTYDYFSRVGFKYGAIFGDIVYQYVNVDYPQISGSYPNGN